MCIFGALIRRYRNRHWRHTVIITLAMLFAGRRSSQNTHLTTSARAPPTDQYPPPLSVYRYTYRSASPLPAVKPARGREASNAVQSVSHSGLVPHSQMDSRRWHISWIRTIDISLYAILISIFEIEARIAFEHLRSVVTASAPSMPKLPRSANIGGGLWIM